MKLISESKLLFGVIIGIFLSLCILYYYKNVLETHACAPNFVGITDTTLHTNDLPQAVTALKIANTNIEEKIASLNKRFDDLYVLGGIIITLLLAINVGVYLKTEHEVGKQFKENFTKYKEDIIKINADAQEALEQIKSKAALADTIKKSKQSQSQSPEQESPEQKD